MHRIHGHLSPALGRAWLLALAWGAALLLVAAVAAEAFWMLRRPAAEAASFEAQRDPRAAAARIIAVIDPNAPAAGGAAQPAPSSLAGLSLAGVATGFSGGTAFALVRDGATVTPLLVGESARAGIVLRRIHPDRVEFDVHGTPRTLFLDGAGEAGPIESMRADPK